MGKQRVCCRAGWPWRSPLVLPAGPQNLFFLVSCLPGTCCHFSACPWAVCEGLWGIAATMFCLCHPLVSDTHLFLSLRYGGKASEPHNAINVGHTDVSKTIFTIQDSKNQLISPSPSFPSVHWSSLSTYCVPGVFQLVEIEPWSKQTSRCP